MDKSHLEAVISLRHELHTHPELSNNEHWTKKRLMTFISANTSLTVVDKGMWFYAVYQHADTNPIAFRADMDAVAISETIELPYKSIIEGVAHKCGHDGHSAVLAGLALEIDKYGADRTVYFIFQHAEEIGIGARECIDLIKEKRIPEIYAFHNMAGMPNGAVAIKRGIMNCASQGMTIHMRGTPAHASLPETGKNPSFAIAELVRIISESIASGKYDDVWCTIVQIAVGDGHFGISAGEGKLLLTCRGKYEEDMNTLCSSLEKTAHDLASCDGLECSITYSDIFPETRNHDNGVEKVCAVCQKLGVAVVDMAEPMRASEDFGHFLKHAVGAMFLVQYGDRSPIHTAEYDFCDDIIECTVEIFKNLI